VDGPKGTTIELLAAIVIAPDKSVESDFQVNVIVVSEVKTYAKILNLLLKTAGIMVLSPLVVMLIGACFMSSSLWLFGTDLQEFAGLFSVHPTN
jgi:hypothetical protein